MRRHLQNLDTGSLVIGVLESMADGFAFLDNDWIVRYWNQSAADMLDAPAATVTGRSIWEVFPEAKKRISYTEYHRAKAENIAVEFRIFFEATDCWLDVKAFPSPEGLALYFKDVTAKLELTSALKHQTTLFASLIDKGADMMAIIDEAGNYKFVSSNVERIFGYRPTDLVGKNAFAFIHPDDSIVVNAGLQDVVNSMEVEIREFRFLDAHGQWKWVEVIATNMLQNEVIQGIIINSREITEWKQNDEALKNAFFSISLQNHKLREIAFIQSHEVRKPVANILGLAAIMQHESNTAKDPQLLEMLISSTEELDSIIKKIVQLTDSVLDIVAATADIDTTTN